MNRLLKVLYYIRLVTFVISLIIIFLMIKTIVKVGLFGYVYLFFEFLYIIMILLMILSKNKKFKSDWAFNVMQIGTYIYLIIVFARTLKWNVTSIALDSFVFYRNNFIIQTLLLLTLILYITAIVFDKNKPNKK